MKKTLSSIVVLCLFVALLASLASCQHTCEAESHWSHNGASHWHDCKGKNCTEVFDKADHIFDKGNITVKPTQEKDGTKTYTCSVCSYKKEETVVFTGLTQEEWEAAFEDSVFENFSFVEDSTVKSSSTEPISSKSVTKYTKNAGTNTITVSGDVINEQKFTNKIDVETNREITIDSIKELSKFSDFEYDKATKTYKATKDIRISALNASTKDITLRFENNRLVEIKYSVKFTMSGIKFEGEATMTLSYGDVVIN